MEFVDRGKEHEVFRRPGENRVIKFTNPGLVVKDSPFPPPSIEQYLGRLNEANRVFKDDIQLENVINTPQGIVLVTSQPYTKPDPHQPHPTHAELNAWLRKNKFGYSDGAWMRRDGVLLEDTHPGNFIRTPDGKIVPVDVHVSQHDPAQWTFPTGTPEYREGQSTDLHAAPLIPVASVDAALPPHIDNWINHAYDILHEREAEARRAGAPLDREAYDALRSEGVRRQTGRHLGQHPGQLLDPAQDSQLRRGRGQQGNALKPPFEKEEGLQAAFFHLHRSRLKGRAVLSQLPDHVPATPQECEALLRHAVAVYQSLYPALWRRFRRGSTSGRSGLETQFRDASGRITPESVRHARISVQEDKLATDLRGLSPRQTVFHMEHALGEEVRHLASLHAALALWEHSHTRLPLEPWLTGSVRIDRRKAIL